MKKFMLLAFVTVSLHAFSQTGINVGESCSPSYFKYSDAVNNYSVCVPKNYTLKHFDTGVSFTDTSNAQHEILIQSVTNAKNTSLQDWVNNTQRALSNGTSTPTFTLSDFIVSTYNGARIKGQQLKANYKEGEVQTNIILLPLEKDFSKILMIIYVESPNSTAISDVVFTAKMLLMIVSLQLIS
ncbi:MAG: hypothetical protein Q8891_08710 [Bacteroidota bacterium]|nr:hypothetical protein [Bacteroidota bacterium]